MILSASYFTKKNDFNIARQSNDNRHKHYQGNDNGDKGIDQPVANEQNCNHKGGYRKRSTGP